MEATQSAAAAVAVDALDHLPTFEEIARFAPFATLTFITLYVGWLARKNEVKALREFIEYLKQNRPK